MRILLINEVCGITSTGRICTDLAKAFESQGNEVKIAYGRDKYVPKEYQKYAIRIGTQFGVNIHALRTRIFDTTGFGSKRATQKFVKWVEEYKPDIIHLHNLHGYYINIEILFNYLKNFHGSIIWTLHDCWAFTGHCAYFDYVACEKWMQGCHHCPQRKAYPASRIRDNSCNNYYMKKKIFTGIHNLKIVVPSNWLKKLVEKSFLKEYSTTVIYNGIDLSVFKPTASDLKKKYGVEDKKIILGVANIWDRRKGLNSFLELSKIISNEYCIMLVGLNKKQINILPDNIIGVMQTKSREELAEFYTMSDVFVNPTLEDNYPTTNLEAIACNTPVITYETGGSTESAQMFGTVVEKGNIEMLWEAIKNIERIEKKQIDISGLDTVKKYISLYEEEIREAKNE